MSAFGRGASAAIGDEIVQVLRVVRRELEDLGRSTRAAGTALFQAAAPAVGGVFASQANATGAAFQAAGAAAANGAGLGGVAGAFMGGGVPGLVAGAIADNFLVNATMGAARDFGRDVAFGTAQDFARFGFGQGGVSPGASVAANALRAGANLPILGDIFAEAQQPIEQTGARLKGTIATLARAGVPMAQLEEMARQLRPVYQGEEIRAKQSDVMVDRLMRDPDAIGQAVAGSDNVGRLLDSFDRLREIVEASIPAFGFLATLGRAAGVR